MHSVFALNLEIEKLSKDEVMVAGIDRPVVFDFKIKNLEGEKKIEFFNLLGFKMTPSSPISFGAGEEKEIEITLLPLGEFNYMGSYTLTCYIQDELGEQEKKALTFSRIELKDAFEIGANSFDPDSNSVEIYLKNTQNFDFGKIKADFSSEFFNFDEEFGLGPMEEKTFTVELKKEDFKQLIAGFYTMNTKIEIEDVEALVTSNLEFKEKNKIKTEKKDSGFLIRTNIIKKINEGNVLTDAEVSFSKNIISRLFSSFNPEPDNVERKGFVVFYGWEKELGPGEVLEVSVKTNWIFPLVLIVLVIVIVILVKQYTSGTIVVRKKVSFVRAKGGEFALKVSIYIHAKKYLENINVVERLPPLVKLYEQFGFYKPAKIDEKKRLLNWNFEKLEAGEVRTVSYIIYSKLGVMGKFSLPATRVIFEKEGEIHEASSNRAFFVSEPRGEDIEEE